VVVDAADAHRLPGVQILRIDVDDAFGCEKALPGDAVAHHGDSVGFRIASTLR
jgi:hypothetical protein